MNKFYLLLLLFTANLYPQGGRLVRNPLRDIPRWVRLEFSARRLDKDYTITFRLYPRFLRGDFNGDGKRDVAIQIADKQTGKEGIAIFHGKKSQSLVYPISILGAGKSIGNSGDDFRWSELWDAEKRGKQDMIRLIKRNSRTGVIVWDGKNYSFSSK